MILSLRVSRDMKSVADGPLSLDTHVRKILQKDLRDLQTTPKHADPHGLGAFSKKTIQEIHMDRRVLGWSVGHHVDHPCGWQISPWPAREVTDISCQVTITITKKIVKRNNLHVALFPVVIQKHELQLHIMIKNCSANSFCCQVTTTIT